jgi:hypothetical protein
MGEQGRFFEACAVGCGADWQGETRQRHHPFQILRAKRQRNQPRPRLGDVQAELACDPIAEIRRAHFRDRLAAGGDHQCIARSVAAARGELKTVAGFLDRFD